jgi:eukaryotic-like serine/threonine-protein kinase
MSVTGSALGTVAYMSPEQVRGEDLDARTDLFSFGAVLYEMATGQHAFSGRTSGVIFDAILNREPASVHQVNPQVPVGDAVPISPGETRHGKA